LALSVLTCNLTSKEWDNGLFYQLGIMASDDKKIWKSPIPALVSVTSSSTEYGNISILVSNTTGLLFYPNPTLNEWILFTLTKPIRICPTHYAIKTRGSGDAYHPRNWILEGSMDGKVWTTLSNHQNEARVTGLNQIYKWKLSPNVDYFSFFRFRPTGKDSDGKDYLIFQNVEFYGMLIGI